ncbi:MAG: hypothetical protein VB877_17990 [Pirellulaceae bacterium]
MSKQPDFDLEKAHQFLAVSCFNRAWELIDKTVRTTAEDEQMIQLAQASLWHWTQRTDCSDKNLSIGYWQVSRVYALVGEADNARKHAHMCLEKTPPGEPFFLGYAYEALARAEVVADSREKAREFLTQARQQLEKITGDEEKKLLGDDLETLE